MLVFNQKITQKRRRILLLSSLFILNVIIIGVGASSGRTNTKNSFLYLSLNKFVWVHDACSWLHAFMCITCYGVLTYKVYNDRSALGISLQTLCALCFSEFCGALLNIWFSIYTGIMLDWSFQIDILSTVLSVLCLYTVWSRFSNTIEDQYDTFGLNILVRVLMLFGSNSIDKEAIKNGERAGKVRPTGLIGSFSSSLYWLVLYILAIPLSIIFLMFRTRRRFGIITSLLAYDDAIRALALLPQLYMFHIKSPRKVSEHLALFMMFEFSLKILALVYWLSMPLFRMPHESRNYNIVVQLFNIGILLDFAYHYFRAKLSGEKSIQYASDLVIPFTL
ncbi:protein with signal peptide and 6 transmembrane domains [Cryptosporidium ryanae]|uniref:protein with signal peptide and 6 transmembrane domains n=1 Tax=Cryptosporidium ryanae TaxID=515981 RepID=UPI00351A858A|nr:protein with signal peptide and 6 transmembrane domains [Cryptosporidium ryanae]